MIISLVVIAWLLIGFIISSLLVRYDEMPKDPELFYLSVACWPISVIVSFSQNKWAKRFEDAMNDLVYKWLDFIKK